MSIKNYVSRFGILYGILAWLKIGLGHRGVFGAEYSVRLPGYISEIYMRAKTSDHMAFVDLILNGGVDSVCNLKSGVVVDAGANVGFFAINVSIKNPGCRVLCIELDEGNFKQLLKNIKGYGNITAINAGLWHERGSLKLKDPTAADWAKSAESDDSLGGVAIPAITMIDVLSHLNTETIRLLKIDIEGGEVELFSANTEWIERIEEIYIELHDRFRSGCETSLLSAIGNRRFTRALVDEYTVIRFGI
jgi:FkbM family methyltransferase